VLVVDDEAAVRKSVRLTLAKAGYDSEIQMPKIDGNEAIVWFRSQFPSVPIVVMTGNPNIGGATNLMKQGVVEYLSKPVQSSKLIEVINKVARSHVYRDRFKV